MDEKLTLEDISNWHSLPLNPPTHWQTNPP
jgi:hypothetical protein